MLLSVSFVRTASEVKLFGLTPPSTDKARNDISLLGCLWSPLPQPAGQSEGSKEKVEIEGMGEVGDKRPHFQAMFISFLFLFFYILKRA